MDNLLFSNSADTLLRTSRTRLRDEQRHSLRDLLTNVVIRGRSISNTNDEINNDSVIVVLRNNSNQHIQNNEEYLLLIEK